jgi:hypothetical protein
VAAAVELRPVNDVVALFGVAPDADRRLRRPRALVAALFVGGEKGPTQLPNSTVYLRLDSSLVRSR